MSDEQTEVQGSQPTYFGVSLEQYAISLRDERNALSNENAELRKRLAHLEGKYGLPNYSVADIEKELMRRRTKEGVGDE